jgi:tRNA A-37 threonylcarbamoyl transferase component Bud32
MVGSDGGRNRTVLDVAGLNLGTRFKHGKIGAYSGWLSGVPVAAKIALSASNSEALLHEHHIYQQLEGLQGVSIPKLLLMKHDGAQAALVTALCGEPLESRGQKRRHGRAAMAALAAVHACGILHGDVRTENFVSTSDGHVSVLDFHMSRPGSAEEMQEEKMQLEIELLS